MAEITVFFNIKEEPNKEKITEELKWYDTVKQEMLFFNGGKLTFKYQEDDYLVKIGASERQRRGIKSTFRMLPEVEEVIVANYFNMIRKTNQKQIENWFYSSEYVNDIFVEDITNESIIFEVPDNLENDFFDELDNNGFKY